MSSFSEFWIAIGENPDLQDEIRALGDSMAPQQIVDIAAKHNFKISTNDLTDLQEIPDDRELTQKELQMASGGRRIKFQRTLTKQSYFDNLKAITKLDRFFALMQTEYANDG